MSSLGGPLQHPRIQDYISTKKSWLRKFKYGRYHFHLQPSPFNRGPSITNSSISRIRNMLNSNDTSDYSSAQASAGLDTYLQARRPSINLGRFHRPHSDQYFIIRITMIQFSHVQFLGCQPLKKGDSGKHIPKRVHCNILRGECFLK